METPISDVSREIDDCVERLFFYSDHLKDAISEKQSVENVVYLSMMRDEELTLLEKLERRMVYMDPGRTSREGDITPAIIEQAKEYPIKDMLEVNRAGFARCLWHEEKTPSMKITNNKVHCFGCGQNGDAIDVYQKIHGGTFFEAVKALCH